MVESAVGDRGDDIVERGGGSIIDHDDFKLGAGVSLGGELFETVGEPLVIIVCGDDDGNKRGHYNIRGLGSVGCAPVRPFGLRLEVG